MKAILAENGFDVVGEPSDGYEAMQPAQTLAHEFQCLRLRCTTGGVDAAPPIFRESAKTKLLIVTMYTDDRDLREFTRRFQGFFIEEQDSSLLAEPFGPYLVEKSISVLQRKRGVRIDENDARDDALSDLRKRIVLRLIGEHLRVSSKTVDYHRARVMQASDIRNGRIGSIRYPKPWFGHHTIWAST